MAYGDVLRVRVRSTGDFRFERPKEVEIDEVGLIVRGSIEVDMDELSSALELDTRGIPVREFTGTQRYWDAGADSGALEFVVNVAADISAVGITATVAYIKGKLAGRGLNRGELPVGRSVDEALENAAIDIVANKYGSTRETIRIEAVEHDIAGNGSVELRDEEGNQFRIDLDHGHGGIVAYRVRRARRPS